MELTSAEAGEVLSVVTRRMLGQAAAPTQGLRRTLLARLAALVRSGATTSNDLIHGITRKHLG